MSLNSSQSAYGQLPVIPTQQTGSTSTPWKRQPDLPTELSAAVAKRLTWLKSHLLDIVVDNLNRAEQEQKQAGEQQGESTSNEELQLGPLLNLDEAYLQSLETWDFKSSWLPWLPRVFGAWAEAEIEELLTEEQRREFREVGISSLLSRVEYPWEREWMLRLQQLNYNCQVNAWEGEPDWSAELTTAVAKRLTWLKSHLLDIVVKYSNTEDQEANQLKGRRNEELQLPLLLNLDESYLQNLESWDDRIGWLSWLPRVFGAWAEAEIEELLTEEQRREFREVGISSLLSCVEYPWEREWMLRLQQLGYNCQVNAWEGEPDWSAELTTAVAKRLTWLKSHLLDIVVKYSNTEDQEANQLKGRRNEELQLPLLLNLDESYLQNLESWDDRIGWLSWLPRVFGAWAEAEIEELLTEEQRREFREVGISSLLSCVEYPWEREWMLRLQQLGYNFQVNAWEGEPDWSAELTAAVAERLFRLKSQLLELVVQLVLSGKNKQASSEEEGQRDLELLLRLDEEFLQTHQVSYPEQVEQFRSLRDGAVAEIEELLSEEQRREFQEVGLSSLLSRIEYPWETDLRLRLNMLPMPTLNANEPLAADSEGDQPSSSVGFMRSGAGAPDWPAELKSAVARRLVLLKSQLLDVVAQLAAEYNTDGDQQAGSADEQEGQDRLQRLLNLDEGYLQNLESSDPQGAWLPRTFGAWTEVLIEELLSEDQRREFQEVGLSSLLSRIEYPWETDLRLRLNMLPMPMLNANEPLAADSEGDQPSSSVGFMRSGAAAPDWPAELKSAVARRLVLLKSQLLDVVAQLAAEYNTDGDQQASASKEQEGQDRLQRLLNLDEGYLQNLESSDPQGAWLPRTFGAWTEVLIEELLSEDQRREFQEVGLSSLLSRIEYPWETELMLRLNKLHIPYFSTNEYLQVESQLSEQASTSCAVVGWEGTPEWPAELTAAVTKRLILLKSQVLDIVVQLAEQLVVRGGDQHPAETVQSEGSRNEQEGQAELQRLLNLDEDYLQNLESSDPQAGWLPRTYGAWTAALIEELLSEDQRQEFRAQGLNSLLSQIEFSWDTELVRRLNRSNRGEDESDYRGLFCPRPFEYVEIGAGGKTHLCCAVMLPTVAGDKQTGSFMDVWNSESAQSIRQSILDGTFSHCIEHLCPELQNRTLPKRDEVIDPFHKEIISKGLTVLSRGPKRITMNYDKSCNLACPMCRTERITAKGAEKQAMEEIQHWATREHLKDTREMVISTAGDAFGSATYHTFLRNFDASPYPELRLRLVTNGLHLTPKNWARICHENVDSMHISIDAATPETYRVNRGADFNRLVENLHFAGELRSSGQLQSLSLNYTVQANNFAEMPKFVALASEIHADTVLFIQLANGTFTQEEYQRRAVHQPSHPQHGELLEVLKNPLLQMPMVDLQIFDSLSCD